MTFKISNKSLSDHQRQQRCAEAGSVYLSGRAMLAPWHESSDGMLHTLSYDHGWNAALSNGSNLSCNHKTLICDVDAARSIKHAHRPRLFLERKCFVSLRCMKMPRSDDADAVGLGAVCNPLKLQRATSCHCCTEPL